MDSADVTLFIPVKNGLPYIDDCIGSILSQTFQNWRLVILDNQSTDATGATCARYLSDPRIRYVLNETDIGGLGNFNKALELVDTKYYAIVSHDDFFSSRQALEESFAILERDPDVCAVYSHIDWVDAKSRRVATRRFGHSGKVASDDVARRSIVSCRNLYGVPLLVRHSAAAGKRFDRAFYATVDIDFSIAIGRGASIYVIDRPCFSIRFHSANNTMRDSTKIRSELVKTAEKHGIRIGAVDALRMAANERFMRASKFFFYLYLDHVRGWVASDSSRSVILRFLAVGAMNTAFGLGTYWLFLWIGLPYPVAAGLSLVLGVAFSFNSHRLLVFKAKGRFLRYVLVWLAIYGIDVALIALLRDHVGDYLAGIVLVPIIIVLSFVLMSRFVFRDRLEQGAS